MRSGLLSALYNILVLIMTVVEDGRGCCRVSQEEYASYSPTGGSGVQTFFDDWYEFTKVPAISGGCVKFYLLATHNYHKNGHNSPNIWARDKMFGSIPRF